MALHEGEPSRYDQYRCTMKGMCEIYEKIYKDIRLEHLDLLYNTPFKLLFKALYEKRICKKNRNDDLLDQIILSYNPKKKQFKIGKKYSKIYKSEIQLIFGIQDGKLRVDKNKCLITQTAFTERNFPGVKKVTAKMIKDQIKKVVVKTDEDSVQDTVRLLCLLLFQNCFFTTTGQVLGWTYMKYVEDLSKLNSYDWTYIIHKNLIESLDEKNETPQKVNGCTMALWYWFCERCKTIKPKEDEVAEPNDKDMEYKGIPRVTKWVLSDTNEVFNNSKLLQFKEDEFTWNKLKPTKIELKLMPNTPKDKQSEKTRSQEKEDDDDSDFQESTPKKKRTNGTESPSRKKIKLTEQNDNEEKMKRGLNQQQEREISHKTLEENIDFGMQENKIPQQYFAFDVQSLQSLAQDTVQSVLQEVLEDISTRNGNDQWSDSREGNNQVVKCTPKALKDTVKVNQSTQTEDLDPREEEMQRRELEFIILKSQIKSLNSNMNQLLKEKKQREDKEKASNELAERVIEEFETLKLKVVSLMTENEQLEKYMQEKEEEMKTLKTKLNEMEANEAKQKEKLLS